MKLLYVLHQFFPRFHTGTEQYALALARAARANGDEVQFFTLEPDFEMGAPGIRRTTDTWDGFAVHRISLDRRVFANPVLAEYESPIVEVAFRQALASAQPDLVHFFHLRYLGAGLIDVARVARVPHLAHLMDFWFLCAQVTLLKSDGSLCDGPADARANCFQCAYADLHRHVTHASAALAGVIVPRYQRSLLRHTDGLGDLVLAARLRTDHLRASFARLPLAIAPSRFLERVFRDNGFRAQREVVLSYGVDPDRLRGLQPRRDGTPLTLGYLGSIAQHKGLHVLIDAFTRVRGALALRIHGREDDYADYARDRRYQASRDPRISFHGAFKTEDLGRVLSDVDVLVVPSLWFENTPFVMLEAMAARKPVIAANLGGLSELLEAGRGGATFAAGDATALAAILARLVQAPDEIERWRATVPRVKTLAENYRELRALYDELQRQGMNELSNDPVAKPDQPTVAALQEALAQREREVRDLYDIVAQMAARLLREQK